MNIARRFMVWFFSLEPAWLQKYNEELAGALGAGIALIPGFAGFANGHPGLGAFFIFTVASLVYEQEFDPNGYSLKDVAEREASLLVGLLVLTILGLI